MEGGATEAEDLEEARAEATEAERAAEKEVVRAAADK